MWLIDRIWEWENLRELKCSRLLIWRLLSLCRYQQGISSHRMSRLRKSDRQGTLGRSRPVSISHFGSRQTTKVLHHSFGQGDNQKLFQFPRGIAYRLCKLCIRYMRRLPLMKA